MLLDEPTNHLDIGAIEWLEEHLRRRAGALLVASHDRAFLDATVTRVWELRDRRLTVFRGDYTAYHRQRIERDARAEQRGRESHEDAIAARGRARPALPEPAQAREDARARGAPREAQGASSASRRPRVRPVAPAAGAARSPAGRSESGELVVRLEDLAVGYLPGRGALAPDGTEAAEPVTVARSAVPRRAARRADRDRRPQRRRQDDAAAHDRRRPAARSTGRSASATTSRPAYLAQLRDAAIPGATVLDAILEAIPVTPGEARGYLARFLFRGDDVFKEVRLLSGGERSRLELALLGILPSNLLLLDEPTNHLDIAAREAIEAFLVESPATILVVSHDRRLLETICERLWVVDDGAGRAVRRRLPRVAVGGRRRLDGRGRGARGARTAATARRQSARTRRGAASRRDRGHRRRGRRRRPHARQPPPRRQPGARDQGRARSCRRTPTGAGARPSTASCRGWACARASSSWRSARRPWPRTSSRCAASRASSPTWSGRSRRPRTPGWSSRSRRRDAGAPPGRSGSGITGPIGCGKSQVAGWLAERGAAVDRRGRGRARRDGAGTARPRRGHAAVRRGGRRLPTGRSTGPPLARIVFARPGARLRELEAHRPPGGPAADPRRASRRPTQRHAPAVVIEAIKLVEGGLAALCDEVWLVTCDPVDAARAAPRPGHVARRRGAPDRGSGGTGRATRAGGHARDRHVGRRRQHARDR